MQGLDKLRADSAARAEEEKRQQERKRAILVNMMRYLTDHNYGQSASILESEAGISLDKFDVADNIDLEIIMMEFEEYYQMRMGRRPKLFRKLETASSNRLPRVPLSKASSMSSAPISSFSSSSSMQSQPGTGSGAVSSSSIPTASSAALSSTAAAAHSDKYRSTSSTRERPRSSALAPDAGPPDLIQPISSAAGSSHKLPPAGPGLPLSATKIEVTGKNASTAASQPPAGSTAAGAARRPGIDEPSMDPVGDRLFKPLPLAAHSWVGEMRDLAQIISRDIVVENPNVKFSDIAGQESAKQLLREAVVMPIKYPQLFEDEFLRPWKGVLLYGPPGTGKTMLAKAVATECNTTFFNISASSIVSKWRGDSEKLVRTLFELARHHAPSTVFIDEMDSIMSAREGQEHEGSRRMKTELLIQMDGLNSHSNHAHAQVFVLAASNLPWDLDPAMLRRLEKRVFVRLPEAAAREAMFRKMLPSPGRAARDLDYVDLAKQTEGYSGSDIVLLCKEAAMRPVRRVMKLLEQEQPLPTQQQQQQKNGAGAVVLPSPVEIKLEPVSRADVADALNVTKPANTRALTARYEEFEKTTGSSL